MLRLARILVLTLMLELEACEEAAKALDPVELLWAKEVQPSFTKVIRDTQGREVGSRCEIDMQTGRSVDVIEKHEGQMKWPNLMQTLNLPFCHRLSITTSQFPSQSLHTR